MYGSTPLELHAEIHWRITWKFDYIDEPGKCRLNKFTITMPTTITMPKWMDAEGAPAETLALWPSVLSKIRRHEDGHKAIGMEGANVLARRLKSVGEYSLANRAFDRSEALKGSPFKEER